MSHAKYMSVAEADDGKTLIFRGEKPREFETTHFGEEEGDFYSREWERQALLTLPEPMSSDEWKEWIEGRDLPDVISECDAGVDPEEVLPDGGVRR